MKQLDNQPSVRSTSFRKFRIAMLLSFSMAFAHLASAQNYAPNIFTDPDYTAVNNATGVITAGAGTGSISLRSALQAADNSAGAHIITLSAGTYNVVGGPNTGTWIAFGSMNNQNITINGVAGSPLTSIINMAGVGLQQDRIFGVNVLTLGGTVGVNCTINNVRFTNGHLNSDPYGGGAIEFATTGPTSALTLTNCEFINNTIDAAAGTTGGAVNYSGTGTLTVTNCTFTGNTNNNADGGALYYFHNNFAGNAGVMNVTGCTFTNNSATVSGNGSGGALGIALQGRIAPFNQTFTANITKNTFISNSAPGGFGGAMIVNNGDATYTININHNRFVSNTSSQAANSGLGMNSASGSVNATNNWWGCNTDPATAGACNRAAVVGSGGTGILTTNPWLQLKTTASPGTICNTPAGLGNTTTVTTSFLSNSAGTAVPVGNLTVLLGLPVTWGPTTLGSLSGQQLTVQANGTATATFTSNGTGGNATVNTEVDQVPTNDAVARATIIVHTLPIVSDPVNFTSCVGGTATFTSTITGVPAPTIVWRIGTTALVNGLQASGSTVSGQGTATLTITNVQPGDAGLNYNVQASNECGVATSANAFLAVNSVTGGTVGSDQTICSGGDPAAFTESVASTGSGALTYQWQSSTTSCAAGFSNIASATGTTYDPPAGLATTTFYRRVTTSTLNGTPCTANSNCITVTVNSVTGGTVAADQTICSGGDPAAFTQSVASTGSGVLTYQWQSSTTSCAAGFSDIASATGTTYDPPAGLVTTTFYRRVTTSTLNTVACTAVSSCITVTVNNVTGGTVAADQTVCSGGDPAAFTVSVASTGTGALTYQWQSNTTSCAGVFSNIPSATGATYDPPAGLVTTTYYRRVTTSTVAGVPCTANSNCITVTVNNVTGGTVGSDQTICSGGDPAAFTESVASTGTGALTYQWQSSTTSCAAGFSNIASATGTTYDPPAGLATTTFYRRVTTSTVAGVPCTANSSCITVTVNNVTGGTVAADQAVCPGGDPAAFTQSVASTGTGALTYQWQSSTTSCAAGFSNIAAATGITYDPPAGLATTTFYRRVTTSTVAGVPCTANSNCITVTVNPTNTITLTSAAGTDNQTVLINTPITPITYATTGATGATFSGLPTGVNGAWAANVVTISGTPTVSGTFNYTVTLTGGCGGGTANGTINVITCSITLTSAAGTNAQTICSGAAITPITYSTVTATGASFSGLPAGVTGNWAANVVTISGTPTVTGTFNYTVTATGGGCAGVTANGSITINPTPPTPTITPGGPTTFCAGGSVTLTSSSASGNQWYLNGNPIGGATAQTYVATASGNYTVVVTAIGCPSAPSAITSVTVNPTPTATATPSSQTICSGGTITTIVLSGAGAGATYNWTRNNTGTVTGIANSGAGDISGTLTNTTNAPITVTFTITPTSAANCTGASITATVLVNPTPNAVATPSSQTICSGGTITTIVLSGNVSGTVFNWTRNNTGTVTGIGANGAGDISGALTNTTAAPVTVTFTITPTANGCPGAPITATVLVNPTPNAVATPSAQTICSGGTITTIVLSGNVFGTVFNWVRNNTGTVTGIPANGAGDISGTLTNTTAAPVTVTFTITPTANGCPGAPITATVLVNPTPNAVATPASQTICSANPITTIVLSGGVAGTTYNWTRNNTGTVTGIAANGAGDISGTLTNTTNAPVTVTFTITPTANSCPGSSITATVLVNPTPNAVATPSSQTTCSGQTITPIVITGNVSGTTFNWTRNNTGTVTGIAANGAGDISGALTNTTASPITVTFTIIPTANGCPGAPVTATVLVNPTPDAVATPSSQTICSGSTITTIVLTGSVSGTVFNWTRDNTGSVTGIGASGTGNISGALTNTTNAPVTVTFTIIPTANGCVPGAPITATVLVNPNATINAVPNQAVCHNSSTAAVNFTSPTTGGTIVYNWTNNNTTIGLGASGSGNIPSFVATNPGTAPVVATITVTPTYTNGVTCTGTPITFTITVNPIPNAVATPPSQTVCSGNPITTIVLSGAVSGTTYNWTRNNTVTVTGIPNSGAGNISGTLTNTTNAPITVTFTITPTANGCNGTPITATVLVNPTPTVSGPGSMQVVITGDGNWTDEISYTLTNSLGTVVLSGANFGFNPGPTISASVPATNAPFSFFIEAQGTFNDNSCLWEVRCNGVAVASGCIRATGGASPCTSVGTLTVPNISGCGSNLGAQTICSGSAITPIVPSGPVAGTTFNWTRNNTVAVTGIPASGTGTISGTLTNTTTAPVVVTFTITPTANGCPGPPVTVNVTVNPIPDAVATPSTQTICSGPITPIVLTSAVSGTTYAWTRNNTVNVTGIAASGTGNITGSLINTTLVAQTVTFTIIPTANGCVGAPITATVILNAAPTIACPASVTVPSVVGGCTAVVNYAPTVTGVPVPTLSYTFSGATTGSGSGTGSGSPFNVGVTTVTLTATNICGTATCSFTITVTDSQLPTVTVQPANRTVCAGSNAVFTVTAVTAPSAGGPIAYQWQQWNGSAWVNIAGATTTTLTISNTTVSMNTNTYRVGGIL